MAQLGMLLLRVVVGLIFAMHGWQKFNEFTIAGTQASFQEMGVPMADLAAPGVATLELIGGIAMVLGVLTRIFAALLICDMLGAMFIVHLSNGFFVAKNGLELSCCCRGMPAVCPCRGRPVFRGPRTVRQ